MEPVSVFVVSALFLIFIVLVASNIRIVPQSVTFVIERLGAYKETWQTGLHLKIPFVERVAKQVSIKEQVADFQPQPVITKDNVTVMIDTVVFFQITDPKLYTYGVERPMMAIENLSVTTLRNIIGDLMFDETLSSRDLVNRQICVVLDEATDPWGIKVNRVEIKNIVPPRDIQETMEKQMRAERVKRESILHAEGEKESKRLMAEGERIRQVEEAEGMKQAAILRAEAAKEAAIREAEGEAEAILTVQHARAEAIRMINDAAPGQAYLTIQSLDAFAKVADGKATKIIIPSEIQGIAGLAQGLAQTLKTE